jgi:hypothetical protein
MNDAIAHRTVTPLCVNGVGEAYFFGISGIPGIFCCLHFLRSGFKNEWW